jgi:alkanesulfonate monooxygenase SsuD/methylene tetrahydromethanopterin reductase-like flavin-dependent oxidoreductase (luciferase family)
VAGQGWLDRVGVVIAPVGVSFAWWRDAAVRLDAAGYAGLWTWDHLASRGTGRAVLEAWTTLAAVAPVTRRATLGTLVTNVMTRHPAVLARSIATLQEASGGRVRVGIGIGGDAAEHHVHGIPLPPATERVTRLEEAVAVMRALWSGGAVTRPSPHYPLDGALGGPAPEPRPPIVVAGQSRAGARMAARVGDGWTTRPDLLEALLPVYREACDAAGRPIGPVIVGMEGPRFGVDYVAGTGWAGDPERELAGWQARGADEVVLTARTDADIEALVETAGA